jgi:PII-like signaling protein
VIADGLKLTTYLGERDRAGGAFVADALLDLYERRGVRLGTLLRGAEGFGLEHHLRTDRVLTLSEDLPLVTVAVDVPERIEALAGEVAAIQPRGLLTLERARLLTDATGEALDEPDGATKVTVYLGRREPAARRPAFVAVCELLHGAGVAGATVLLGVDGTVHGRRTRASFLGRNGEVPVMVIAVGDGDRIAGVLPALAGLVPRALLTVERVRICKRDGTLLARPPLMPESDGDGLALWQKLTVHTSEASLAGGIPVHRAIVRRLRENGARGATCVRGIWGFHGEHGPHGDRLLRLRRHVPVVTVVVDAPDRIGRSFDAIDELTAGRGLVTSETVPALTARAGQRTSGGLRLAAVP